jgi:uncharacterized protein YbbC (DUF1343 family)
VNVVVTDRANFNSVRTGIEIAAALRKLYPGDWNVDRYLRLLVNGEVLEQLKRGDSPEMILAAWKKGTDEFEKRRAPFLLYK